VYVDTNYERVCLCVCMYVLIFILVIKELDAQNLFYNKFISCLYMFRAHGARNM